MIRSSCIAIVLLLTASLAFAVAIPEDELEPFGYPCDLTVTEIDNTRTLSWPAVSGASTYKVGRIPAGKSVEGLAEVTGTAYNDVSWDSSECYEYVMVAYDSGGNRICSAHVENVGQCSGL